ncbi:aliphatic sulfonate ABC transporter substrate-binding protein [Tessaracoccus sp. Z1128]
MPIRRRTLLGALAALPVAGTLAACSDTSTGTSGELITINYGYIPDFNGTSLLAIANDQKLWEKHGLKANLQTFTNGPLQIQAIGTGDLDFGYIGPGAMWLPASGKAKLLTINGVGQADRLIAQPGIASIADLKGKKVAIPEGTSGDMITQLALQASGMSMADIEKVAMDPATVVSAFAAKQVDAAGIWYPMIDTIKQQVPDLVELAKNSDFADVMQFPNVMVTGPDYPSENEETTLRTLRVLREAMDFRATNLDATVELVAAMNQLEVDAVKADASNGKYYTAAELDGLTEDGTIETWLGAMNDYFNANGKIEGDVVAPSDFYVGELFMKAGQ